jgi:hypothetical protein
MSEQQLRQKLVQLMARLGPMQAEIKVLKAVATQPAAGAAAVHGTMSSAALQSHHNTTRAAVALQ